MTDMTLTQRAQIVETFLHELGHPPVINVNLSNYRTEVHTRTPHPDFPYQETTSRDGTFYQAQTIRKGLIIDLVAFVVAEVTA